MSSQQFVDDNSVLRHCFRLDSEMDIEWSTNSRPRFTYGILQTIIFSCQFTDRSVCICVCLRVVGMIRLITFKLHLLGNVLIIQLLLHINFNKYKNYNILWLNEIIYKQYLIYKYNYHFHQNIIK